MRWIRQNDELWFVDPPNCIPMIFVIVVSLFIYPSFPRTVFRGFQFEGSYRYLRDSRWYWLNKRWCQSFWITIPIYCWFQKIDQRCKHIRIKFKNLLAIDPIKLFIIYACTNDFKNIRVDLCLDTERFMQKYKNSI